MFYVSLVTMLIFDIKNYIFEIGNDPPNCFQISEMNIVTSDN